MKSENILAVELLRYYQQERVLIRQKTSYQKLSSLIAYNTTMQFYLHQIKSLRAQLHENYPNRLHEIDSKLAEIDTKRANDFTVNEPEFIS
jgi:hypothetical protein